MASDRPEAAVRVADRVVVQAGIRIGEREDCALETLSDATAVDLSAALAALNSGETLVLSPDHALLTVQPPSAEWLAAAAEEAKALAQRTNDQQAVISALAASGWPSAAAALARLLGAP